MNIELDEGVLTRRITSGPRLYYAAAMPAEANKAVVAMLHGYADHSARYSHVMRALAEHGIGSVMIDMRGHGRAHGTRGFCNCFGEFLDDARELQSLALERAKGAPRFLFGHSFGGLVAAMSALDDPTPWRGLVLSAPFFGLAIDVSRGKLLAAKVASRIVPKFGLPSGLAGKDLTHDVDKAHAYDGDPLVFKTAKARWFTESIAAQHDAFARASRLSMPLYITLGKADRIASMHATKLFFDAAGSRDKTWDARERLFHEVLNEPSWKDIVDAMARWIDKRAS
ncbi:MAG: lysophospholipase [Polyangiaceae bacterium]|nr:lysophospholipase [Polyangiaceae bacterium]